MDEVWERGSRWLGGGVVVRVFVRFEEEAEGFGDGGVAVVHLVGGLAFFFRDVVLPARVIMEFAGDTKKKSPAEGVFGRGRYTEGWCGTLWRKEFIVPVCGLGMVRGSFFVRGGNWAFVYCRSCEFY